MHSVLGKLIQKEFGREKYRIYRDKLDHEECLGVYSELYEDLEYVSDDGLDQRLKRLLYAVQLSVRISEIFPYITIAFVAALCILVTMPVQDIFKWIGGVCVFLMYIYKIVEYCVNRFCGRDVRIMLIYKTVLFRLLSEDGD